jgi:hypothetical protein
MKAEKQKESLVLDTEAKFCLFCNTKFGAFKKRFYCANCAKASCEKDARERTAANSPALKPQTPIRLCDACYVTAAEAVAKRNAKEQYLAEQKAKRQREQAAEEARIRKEAEEVVKRQIEPT